MKADPTFVYSNGAQMLVLTVTQTASRPLSSKILSKSCHEPFPSEATALETRTIPLLFSVASQHHSATQFFKRSLRPPRRLALATLLPLQASSLLWGSLPSSREQRSTCHPAPRKTNYSFRKKGASLRSLGKWVELGVDAKGRKRAKPRTKAPE